MKVLKLVTFLAVFYSQSNIGVNAVPVEVDLRLTPEQKKVMDKVVNLTKMNTILLNQYKYSETFYICLLQYYFSLRRS